MRAHLVEMELDGKVFTDFKSTNINSSLQSMSSEFSITVPDIYETSDRKLLKAGKTIKIKYEGELVFTGIIERVNATFDKNDHTISLSGRSLVGALMVDNASDEVEYKDMSPVDIIKKKAEESKVKVVDNRSQKEKEAEKNIDKIHKRPNVSNGKLSQEMATRGGVIQKDTPNGELEITTSDNARKSGQLNDDNILGGSLNVDISQSFSEIKAVGKVAKVKKPSKQDENNKAVDAVIAGKEPTKPKENSPEEQKVAVKSTNELPITKKRVIQSTSNDQEDLNNTVAVEQSQMVRNEFSVSFTVYGWKNTDGVVYRTNDLINVKSSVLDIYEDLLIESVSLNQDKDSGTLAEITLTKQISYAYGNGTDYRPITNKDKEKKPTKQDENNKAVDRAIKGEK